jgi:threonyl-tRNA synthetase
MQLNDGHVFCAPDQVAGEAGAALEMIRQAHAALGIRAARYRLSLAADGERGAGGKYAAAPGAWEQAAGLLAGVLKQAGIAYEAEAGEAAFYGPKIDVQVTDAAGRESTLSTVQVDFYQPERFGLEYAGPDGARHRPVMVHRSIIGSLERAVALLTEVHGGAFPPWLAPVQVLILPVTEAEAAAGADLWRQAAGLGLRAEVAGPERGTLGARVRAGRLVPYQAVIGAREAAAGQVAVRLRDGRRPASLPAAAVLARMQAAASTHGPGLWEAASSG